MANVFSVVVRHTYSVVTFLKAASFSETNEMSRGSVHLALFFLNVCGYASVSKSSREVGVFFAVSSRSVILVSVLANEILNPRSRSFSAKLHLP